MKKLIVICLISVVFCNISKAFIYIESKKNVSLSCKFVPSDRIAKLMNKGLLNEKLYNTNVAYDAYTKAVMADSSNFENVLVYSNFLNKSCNSTNHSTLKWYYKCLQLAKDDDQKSRVYSQLGSFYFAKEQYKDAISNYVNAIDLYKKLNVNKRELVVTLSNLACVYAVNEQYKDAESNFLSALEMCKTLSLDTFNTYNECITVRVNNSTSSIITCGANNTVKENNELSYFGEGYTKYYQSNYKTIILREQKVNSLFSVIYSNVAYLYEKQNKLDDAITNYNEALNHYEKNEHNIYDIVKINSLIISALLKRQQYASIEPYYFNIINLYELFASKEPKYRKSIVAQYLELAEIETQLNQSDKAIATYKSTVKICDEAILADSSICPKMIRTYNLLANIYFNIKQNNEAEECFDKAIEMCKKMDHLSDYEYKPNLAILLNNKSWFYYSIENYEKAKKGYEQAIVIFNELINNEPDYYKNLANCYNKLGLTEQSLHNFTFADDNINKAIGIYQQIGDSVRLALNYYYLAKIQTDEDQYGKAGVSYKTSTNLYKELIKGSNNYYDDYVYVLTDAAKCCCNRKDFTTAVIYYTVAINTIKQFYDDNIDNAVLLAKKYDDLAYVQYLKDDLKESETNYFNELNIYDKLSQKDTNYLALEAMIYTNLAWMQYQTKLNAAIQNSQKAINLFSNCTESNSEVKSNYAYCLNNMSWFQLLDKHFVEAEKYARLAITKDSSISYMNLAFCFLYQGKHNESLKYFEDFKTNENYRIKVLARLCDLEKAGITHPDLIKIKTLFKN